MPKILIIVTNYDGVLPHGKKTGWYAPEVAHPYHEFTKANYSVDFASPNGGYAPVDEGSVKDYANDSVVTEFLNNKDLQERLQNTIKASEINPADYVAIFYAGGHGPMFDVPQNEDLSNAAAAIYEKGGAVGALCHGPVGLVNIKLSNGKYLVDGKKVTGFTNAEEDAVKLTSAMPFLLETKLRERGAVFIPAPEGLFKANVQSDARVVTGQNPASATGTAKALLDAITH